MPQIFATPLINYQIAMQVMDSMCIMEEGNKQNHSRFSRTQPIVCSVSAQQHVPPQWGIPSLARMGLNMQFRIQIEVLISYSDIY